jgi:hypothetical protein
LQHEAQKAVSRIEELELGFNELQNKAIDLEKREQEAERDLEIRMLEREALAAMKNIDKQFHVGEDDQKKRDLEQRQRLESMFQENAELYAIVDQVKQNYEAQIAEEARKQELRKYRKPPSIALKSRKK